MRTYPENGRRSSWFGGLIAVAVFVAGIDVGRMASGVALDGHLTDLARVGHHATQVVAKGASLLAAYRSAVTSEEGADPAADEASGREIHIVVRPARPPCQRHRRGSARTM